jgi:hypothetical protein
LLKIIPSDMRQKLDLLSDEAFNMQIEMLKAIVPHDMQNMLAQQNGQAQIGGLPFGGHSLVPKPYSPRPRPFPVTPFPATYINSLSASDGQPAPLEAPRRKRGRPSRKELEERRRRQLESRPSDLGPMDSHQTSSGVLPSPQHNSGLGEPKPVTLAPPPRIIPDLNPLSPLGEQPAPLEAPKKKRGRPLKKKYEERVRLQSESQPSDSGSKQPYETPLNALAEDLSRGFAPGSSGLSDARGLLSHGDTEERNQQPDWKDTILKKEK